MKIGDLIKYRKSNAGKKYYYAVATEITRRYGNITVDKAIQLPSGKHGVIRDHYANNLDRDYIKIVDDDTILSETTTSDVILKLAKKVADLIIEASSGEWKDREKVYKAEKKLRRMALQESLGDGLVVLERMRDCPGPVYYSIKEKQFKEAPMITKIIERNKRNGLVRVLATWERSLSATVWITPKWLRPFEYEISPMQRLAVSNEIEKREIEAAKGEEITFGACIL